MPRDIASAADVDPTLWTVATYLESTNWSAERLSAGRWLLPTGEGLTEKDAMRQILFGAHDAIPVVGDFNGDGVSEVGVYYHGEWFLDLNGNGRWDEGPIYAAYTPSRIKPSTIQRKKPKRLFFCGFTHLFCLLPRVQVPDSPHLKFYIGFTSRFAIQNVSTKERGAEASHQKDGK